MKGTLILVCIDTNYCNYLRNFDSKVPYNFDKKAKRPFVGALFKVNHFMYFAPLSSPKPKHLKLKSKLDFLKIDGGKLGAINFNNMLPVTKKNITKIDLDKICKNKEEKKYIKLLKEQIFWLNRHDKKILDKSKRLYNQYINGTLNKNIAERCCDFKLLETKCLEYSRKN